MLPDRVSNPGPLTYESGALPIALRGPGLFCKGKTCIIAKLQRIHFVICSHSRKRQTVSNSRIQYFSTSKSLLNPIKIHLGIEMHV